MLEMCICWTNPEKQEAVLFLLTVAPIALTCFGSKIFETLLSSHFLDHLEFYFLLPFWSPVWLSAFEVNWRYIFLSLRRLLLSLRDYGVSCVVVLNISKASDRTWRVSLLSEFHSFGFSLFFAYSYLVFCQVAPFLDLLMEWPFLYFLLIVMFLKILCYLQLYSYFSLVIFSATLRNPFLCRCSNSLFFHSF